MVIESCIACHKTVSDQMVFGFCCVLFWFCRYLRLAGPRVSAVPPVSTACPAIRLLGLQLRASASGFFTCVLGMDLSSSGSCCRCLPAEPCPWPHVFSVLRRRSCMQSRLTLAAFTVLSSYRWAPPQPVSVPALRASHCILSPPATEIVGHEL